MDPNSQNTQNQHDDILDVIDALPDPVQQLCHSGQSVNNLAHLAKNMIQVVGGCAEMMSIGLDCKDYKRLQRTWNIFEPNLARLNKFVLDLIKYTRNYSLQKKACDLNRLVQNAIDSCHTIFKNTDVTIRFQEGTLTELLSLDADRITEMITNLITHALDNLPENAGLITLETKYLKDHRQVQLSVCDDGPVLTEEAIRALGRPHERTRDMCGTGFDIPLAKLYIEQHNGYMELQSSKSCGNCVHVYLPIQ